MGHCFLVFHNFNRFKKFMKKKIFNLKKNATKKNLFISVFVENELIFIVHSEKTNWGEQKKNKKGSKKEKKLKKKIGYFSFLFFFSDFNLYFSHSLFFSLTYAYLKKNQCLPPVNLFLKTLALI